MRPLGHAAIGVRGTLLTLRVPAAQLRVTLGATLRWDAYLQWRDGSACELTGPVPCTQRWPADGVLTLATHPRPRPLFEREHRLRLLATGDSMIQLIDGYLAQRVGSRRGATVHSEARIGTGISKPRQLDWVRRARGQAATFKPDVTVMFIGANDGFPLATRRGATAPCCGSAWVAAYERRVEAMMRSYLRGGRSYVYWLTLPAPQPARFARVFPRVNQAIRRAAARVGTGVRVIDLAAVFTPGGRFRQTISVNGRTIDARQPDGVHLSTAGASVAAALVIEVCAPITRCRNFRRRRVAERPRTPAAQPSCRKSALRREMTSSFASRAPASLRWMPSGRRTIVVRPATGIAARYVPPGVKSAPMSITRTWERNGCAATAIAAFTARAIFWRAGSRGPGTSASRRVRRRRAGRCRSSGAPGTRTRPPSRRRSTRCSCRRRPGRGTPRWRP